MPARRNGVSIYLDDDESEDGHEHLNEYTLLDVLGTGSTGLVRRCTTGKKVDGTECEYVLKSMSKRKLRRTKEPGGVDRQSRVIYMTGLDRVAREIDIMSRLRHAHVLQLLEVIDDPEDDALALILEYMPGGAVMQFRADEGCFVPAVSSPERVISLLRDLLSGLVYMHASGVCHRDLKPENLLLDARGSLKIGDLGCAEHFPRESNPAALVSHTAGTPAFWPPECVCLAEGGLDLGLDLDAKNGDGKGGDKYALAPIGSDCASPQFSCYSADYWALGAVVYSFIYARPPFVSDEPLVLFDLIAGSNPNLPGHDNFFAGARSLLHGLLDKDPTSRWTVENAQDALSFP